MEKKKDIKHEKEYLERKNVNNHVSITIDEETPLLSNLNNDNNNIVVSDIRFVNEAEKIKELGGKIYYISRNNKINDYSQHSSESSMELRLNDYIDYKINNNGTIQELYNQFHLAISSKTSIRNI